MKIEGGGFFPSEKNGFRVVRSRFYTYICDPDAEPPDGGQPRKSPFSANRNCRDRAVRFQSGPRSCGPPMPDRIDSVWLTRSRADGLASRRSNSPPEGGGGLLWLRLVLRVHFRVAACEGRARADRELRAFAGRSCGPHGPDGPIPTRGQPAAERSRHRGRPRHSRSRAEGGLPIV